jgi:hypothetical protein
MGNTWTVWSSHKYKFFLRKGDWVSWTKCQPWRVILLLHMWANMTANKHTNYDIILYSSVCQTVVLVLTAVPKQVAIGTVRFSFQHFHWDLLSVDVITVLNGLVISLYVWQALRSELFIYILGALKTKLCIFKISFPMGSDHLSVSGATK